MSPEYRAIAEAIGHLCMAWARLEDDYAAVLSRQLGNLDIGSHQTIRNEIDIRSMSRISKNLAAIHYDRRVSPHLIYAANVIDSEIRPERNRIVHDPIYAFGGRSEFERVSNRTVVTRPQSRKLLVSHMQFVPVTAKSIDLLSACISACYDYLGGVSQIQNAPEEDELPNYAALPKLRKDLRRAMDEYTNSTKTSGTKA